jgi:hypothetical protein
MTSSERFSTGGYALAARTLHLSSDVPGFLSGGDWLGGVRIRGESANPARPLFIGIARKQDVDRYLTGVARSDVVDVTANPLGTSYRPSYRTQAGGKPATPPGRAKFWVASVAGRGNQALTWSVKHGRWAIVVMRPDGARGVSADLAAGGKLPALLWASISPLVFGILTLGGAGRADLFRRPRATRSGAARRAAHSVGRPMSLRPRAVDPPISGRGQARILRQVPTGKPSSRRCHCRLGGQPEARLSPRGARGSLCRLYVKRLRDFSTGWAVGGAARRGGRGSASGGGSPRGCSCLRCGGGRCSHAFRGGSAHG